MSSKRRDLPSHCNDNSSKGLLHPPRWDTNVIVFFLANKIFLYTNTFTSPLHSSYLILSSLVSFCVIFLRQEECNSLPPKFKQTYSQIIWKTTKKQEVTQDRVEEQLEESAAQGNNNALLHLLTKQLRQKIRDLVNVKKHKDNWRS